MLKDGMLKVSRSTEDEREALPVVALALELNRCLFEGRGDDFAVKLADYIRATDLVIGAAAFARIGAAVQAVRQNHR